MFTFLKNIIWIATKKAGSYWMLGNITPGQALAALALPFLAGAIVAGFGVWYITHKRQGWRVLAGDTVAADPLEQLFTMLDTGVWRYCIKCKDGWIEVFPEDSLYAVTDKKGDLEDCYLVYELPITVKQAAGYLHYDGFCRLTKEANYANCYK